MKAQWPKFEEETVENEKFRKTIRNAFNVYFKTAKTLLEMVSLGLELDMGEFEKILDGHASTFRLIHYPPREDTIPDDCILENGGKDFNGNNDISRTSTKRIKFYFRYC